MRTLVVAALVLALSPGRTEATEATEASVARIPGQVRGIYLQQYTLQDASRLDSLIEKAGPVGINTFVVDLWTPSRHYARGIRRVRAAGIEFVPRITLFPGGATRETIRDRSRWEDGWKLAEYALSLGARRIQLDYVRYATNTEPSAENAVDVARVVRFFKQRTAARGAALEIDIFGEVALRDSPRVGQHLDLLAPEVDGLCPMVYPSHFEPFAEHALAPFDVVHHALSTLVRRLGSRPVRVHAYLEFYNYRVPMTHAQREVYFDRQLDAVQKSGVEGWYAWSASNRYDLLFRALHRRALGLPPPDAPPPELPDCSPGSDDGADEPKDRACAGEASRSGGAS